MSDVKSFYSSQIAAGNASGPWVRYEDFERKEFELDAARNRIDVERLRADTAEAELKRYQSLFEQAQKTIGRCNALHKMQMGELGLRTAAAEQRIAELTGLLNGVVSDTARWMLSGDLHERIRAALNPKPEAETK